MAEPCFNWQGKTKNFDLSPEQNRSIWEYAKANYLDKGLPFEDTILRMSKETGAPARLFAEAFSGRKTPILNRIYKLEDVRRRAISDAKDYVRNADTPGAVQAIKAATNLPRAALTTAHGGVFPVTHGGGLLLQPTRWVAFAKGFWTSWKAISPAAWSKARLDLLSHERYDFWRSSGLKINPDEGPQGILSGWLASKPGWSKRAWLGLQRMRLEVADQMLQQYDPKLWNKDLGSSLAEIANEATGVTNVSLGPISKAMFAPQLTTSKFMRAFVRPVETVGTFARMMSGLGRDVSPGERAAAYQRLGHAVEYMAATYAGLQLSQSLFGGKVNFTDPTKSDWLKFKLGPYVLQTRGPEEFIRLLGNLIWLGKSTPQQLRGESPQSAAWSRLAKFAQYKVDPSIQTAGEFMYGRDAFDRPLPQGVQNVRKAIGLAPQVGTPKKPQMSASEYLWSKGPIFMGGAARDVYDDMRSRGLSYPDLHALMRGAAIAGGEFLGFSAYREKDH